MRTRSHGHGGRAANSHAGYTLIEVLVACSLAGAIMAAGLPRIPPMMASFALQNAASEVTNALRLARERAVTTNARGRLAFISGNYQPRRENPAGSGTYVNDGAPRSLPSGITASVNPGDPIFDSRGLTAAPCTITLQNAYAASKTITVTAIGRINVD